jgi:putative DNA primase/helicase
MTDIVNRLKGVRETGDGWTARCPAHSDKHNSLSIAHREGKWLLKCHAGCKVEQVTKALGISVTDLFDNKRRRGRPLNPSSNRATAQPPGLTLEAYAAAKHLSVEFLRGCGLSEVSYERRTAVRIPYLGPTGELLATRFRIAFVGDRFRWKAGSKPQLYGLNRLDEARDAGQVVLVEGESDVHTFWHHGIPALGVPGATNWREDRDAHHLDSIEKIYIVIEPDRGGEAVRKWVSQSAIRDRALLVTLPLKDASALHLDSETDFAQRWQVACLAAVPWTAHEQAESAGSDPRPGTGALTWPTPTRSWKPSITS